MKKLLALVLALVMTLGLATVGANAADFKDESSIEYEEAVNVMSGIGVIQGDDNGNFNPKGTLTREQAAKIIAYMLLGKTGSDSLSASSAPFSDVAADRWSAGAISYCATEGVIAGLGDGSFNPTGLLTGHQFAKMLLVALGYDAKLEGLENNSQWAINAAKLAVSAGLEDDLSIVMSQNISRDQAAKMAFNTLTADMVDYENGVNVKTTDGTDVTVNAKRYKTTDYAEHYDGRVVAAAADDYDKFCEVYFPDLKKNTSSSDFNEPCNQWTFKNTVISEEAKDADKVLTGALTYQDLFNAAGTAAMNKVHTLRVYVDGQLIGTFTAGAAATSNAKSDTIPAETATTYWTKDNDEDLVWDVITGSGTAIASATGANPTGNGTVTSVFVDFDNDNNVYDINVNIKHVYAAKINSVTEASGSDARKVTVSAKTFPSSTIPGVTLDTEYKTNEFKKDDIVLYTASISGTDATIQSMELATLVSGAEVTKTNAEGSTGNYKFNKSVVTAGGKDYKLNVNVKAENTTGQNAIEEFTTGDKFDLYLDTNGYVVWAEKTEEELNLANYLVLVRGGMSSGTGTNPIADAVTLTGTKLSNITISKFNGSTVSGGTAWAGMKLYTIYKYTVNGSNYELKPVTGKYNVVGDLSLNTVDYTSGNANMPGGVGNTATKLVVIDMDDDKISTYTGVANFPEITGTTNNATASVLDITTNAGTNYTNMGIAGYTGTVDPTATDKGAYTVLLDSGKVVAALWAHNSNTTPAIISSKVSASDIIYVTSKNYTTTKAGDDEIYTFDVIKDGKVTTVSTKTGWIKELFANDQDLYQIKAYDGEYVDDVNPRVTFTDSNAVAHAAANTNDVQFAVIDTTAAGVQSITDGTRWGRVKFHTDSTKADVPTDGTAYMGVNVYNVDADVTSGTFKLTLNNANATASITYAAVATNANTKFFEIASNGKVTEVDGSSFNYDAVTKGEFSVIYDRDDQVATYIFYQKV